MKLLAGALLIILLSGPRAPRYQFVEPQPPARAPAPLGLTGPDWEISGVWSDACGCDSFCPCWFNSPATHGTCNSVSLLLIEKGRYASTSLDGMTVVEALSSPSGMTMIETSMRGKLRFNRFYLDDRASTGQKAALQEILRQSFGGKEFQSIAIAADAVPLRHKASIPKILDYEVVLLTGLDGKNPVRLQNAPFTDRSIPELMAGRSVRVTYTDQGERWEFKGRHATFARFHMTRAMYASSPPPK